jgi:CobQ-like glutamine amidotransferase family enzyme
VVSISRCGDNGLALTWTVECLSWGVTVVLVTVKLESAIVQLFLYILHPGSAQDRHQLEVVDELR